MGGKLALLSEQMLAEAKGWARDLVRMESQGPGDLDQAMRRIETRHGVPYSLLWSLRYRADRLKTIDGPQHLALRLAYLAECEQHLRRLKQASDIAALVSGEAGRVE